MKIITGEFLCVFIGRLPFEMKKKKQKNRKNRNFPFLDKGVGFFMPIILEN